MSELSQEEKEAKNFHHLRLIHLQKEGRIREVSWEDFELKHAQNLRNQVFHQGLQSLSGLVEEGAEGQEFDTFVSNLPSELSELEDRIKRRLYLSHLRDLDEARKVPERPRLDGLTSFADICPRGLRGRLKAMAGDYDADIRAFHEQGKYKTARWNRMLAWATAAKMVLFGPFDALTQWAIKALRGGG